MIKGQNEKGRRSKTQQIKIRGEVGVEELNQQDNVHI